MSNSHLAILITCYNRRDITLGCLQQLEQQNLDFDVYLVDDGSTDGTEEAVKRNYPAVKILKGNGNLFWVGGMRLAFSEALKHSYDYYLWLNDDTLLEPDALSLLLNVHYSLVKQGYPNSIVTGSTRDSITGKLTYGGVVRSKRLFSKTFEILEPTQNIQECETMCGNCVLIHHSVAQKIGNLDAAFIHTLGDLDYGLRAHKQGCSLWVAPGYIGVCSKNSVRGSWADPNISFYERLKKVFQIKAFPLRAWTTFVKRHSGFFWYIHWLFPYLRAAIGYRNLSVSVSFKQDI